MPRHSVVTPRPQPPKPQSPVLTVEQKQCCIERLKKCIADLEAFNPHIVKKRLGTREILALETVIDDALSAAFGYGTPTYFRHNLAAALYHGPLITNAVFSGGRLSYGPGSRAEQEAREARHYFSDGKRRSLALLQQAIRTLQDEIAEAQSAAADDFGPRERKAMWRRMVRWRRGRRSRS